MAEYKLNLPLNGVEIYFDTKPDDLILQKLRDGKWRWHRGKHCWYNKISEEAMKFAEELCCPLAKPQITFAPRQSKAINEAVPQTTSYDLIWYTYFFLNRGKPSTHIAVLSRLSDEAIKGNIPPVLERLIETAERILKGDKK